jgi:hypothetical protein
MSRRVVWLVSSLMLSLGILAIVPDPRAAEPTAVSETLTADEGVKLWAPGLKTATEHGQTQPVRVPTQDGCRHGHCDVPVGPRREVAQW